jgi:hypothetical protein
MPNYGLSHHARERFPNGCDWHKPPGCSCRLQHVREQCENFCEDQPTIDARKSDRKMRRILALLFVAFMVAVAMSILTSRANSAELPVPLPLPRHAPTAEAPSVVVATAAKVPFYCRVLLRFERSCGGVRLAAKSLGESRALQWATRCGATSEEIVQAKACLQK